MCSNQLASPLQIKQRISIDNKHQLEADPLFARDPSDSGSCFSIPRYASIIMTQSNVFGELPSNAASNIEAYNLHIPDSEIKHMLDLLKLTPVAGPAYENSLPDGDRHLGIRRDWLVEAKRVWETDFKWQVSCVDSFRLLTLLQEGDREAHQLFSKFPRTHR